MEIPWQDVGSINNVSHFLFLKSLYWICYNIASVLCLGFFGHEACGILAPWPETESAPSALEGKVLTTEPSGKSPRSHFLINPFIADEVEWRGKQRRRWQRGWDEDPVRMENPSSESYPWLNRPGQHISSLIYSPSFSHPATNGCYIIIMVSSFCT